MTTQKILSLADIAKTARALREQGKRVVLCHGTFDLMHTGHIRHLQCARQEGDVLCVTVTADAFVNKGPGRPVFNEQLRAESLAALACVDYVAVNPAVTAVEILNELRPNVYAKGSDYRSHGDDVTGNITLEQRAVEAHGGRLFYTDEITFSSSNLLNEHFNIFPPDTKEFLSGFRSRWSDKEVNRRISSLSVSRSVSLIQPWARRSPWQRAIRPWAGMKSGSKERARRASARASSVFSCVWSRRQAMPRR